MYNEWHCRQLLSQLKWNVWHVDGYLSIGISTHDSSTIMLTIVRITYGLSTLRCSFVRIVYDLSTVTCVFDCPYNVWPVDSYFSHYHHNVRLVSGYAFDRPYVVYRMTRRQVVYCHSNVWHCRQLYFDWCITYDIVESLCSRLSDEHMTCEQLLVRSSF